MVVGKDTSGVISAHRVQQGGEQGESVSERKKRKNTYPLGPQRSQVVSAPACSAEAFGIESRWLQL